MPAVPEHRRLDGARRLLATVYAVPGLGYACRLVVAFAKLPRLNFHIRRLDAEAVQDRARIDALASIEERWRRLSPSFQNAVATIGGFGRQLGLQRAELDRALARLEMLDAENRALSERLRRIEDAGWPRRLAGRASVGPLETAEFDLLDAPAALPFAAGSADSVFIPGGLGRFTVGELERLVLPRIVLLLRPGGVLRVVATDAPLTPEGLGRLLADAGLEEIAPLEGAGASGVESSVEVVGRRPNGAGVAASPCPS